MNNPAEIVSFAMSQEELLAALLIADLPAPPGYESLLDRVFGELPEMAREALLAAAERGLVAHGLLAIEPDGTVLDASVREWLQTVSQPERSWVLLHQPAGEAQRASYFHARGELTLAHFEQLGVHQFVQLSGAPDIQATAIQLVEPLMEESPAAWSGTLPEGTFATLTSGAGTPSAERLTSELARAGWSEDAARAFTEAITGLVSMTACARFNHAATPPLERAFTIVRGQASQWAINPADTPGTLSIRAVDGRSVLRALEEFGSASTDADRPARS